MINFEKFATAVNEKVAEINKMLQFKFPPYYTAKVEGQNKISICQQGYNLDAAVTVKNYKELDVWFEEQKIWA